jgi:hypothetical protein
MARARFLSVNNPNFSSALTGVTLTDSLPAGLVVATPDNIAGTCAGETITAAALRPGTPPQSAMVKLIVK